ncbi:MAG: thiamine-phosphate kinase [Alphaproteobacteria bacterium]|jgi:thiamine-monophosphate kinase|nr:thiamine-phosphate kinase [Alphaproteobacteria bacterium]
MNEFKIIEKYFAPLTKQATTESLGLKDDCAVITSQNQIIINVDSIIEGEHFFPQDPPSSIAHKLLNVNLSDIASMGATPKYWTLAITLPRNSFINELWLQEFTNTLAKIQQQYNFYLISGDTTFSNHSLMLSANIFGEIPKNITPLKKSTAQIGDIICVSGSIGDGYWGLQMRQSEVNNQALNIHISPEDKKYLINRYLYPQARINLGKLLLNKASACTDISDGLWADIEKLCKYSTVHGVINVEDIPLSQAVHNITIEDKTIKSITGGDDYELAFCISEENFAELKNIDILITKIGYIKEIDNTNHHISLFHNGNLLHTSKKGYNY